MKYFVTGATGFIGRHLVRRLLQERGSDVLCLVRDEQKLPEDLRKRVRVLPGGNDRLGEYESLIRSCDVIFHVAALADLGDGDGYRRHNVEFTESLVQIAERSKKLKRFVFTSTIGAVDRTPGDPCTQPLAENAEPFPLSEYGRSKLACEKRLSSSTLPYVILRPALVYGPGMRRRSHVRAFIDSILRGSPSVKFDFPGRVSLVHVADVVDALLLTARHRGAIRRIFFVADDEPVRLGTLFQELSGFLGKRAGRIPVGFGVPRLMRSVRSRLPLQLQNLFSDVLTASNLSLKALGWQARVPRRSSLLETINDHSTQEYEDRGEALVTGGASGIGKALCEQLYARGYRVTLADWDRQRGAATAAEVHGRFLEADLSTAQGLRRVESWIESRRSSLSILVNNAGFGRRGFSEKLSVRDLEGMLAVNCAAVVRLTHAAVSSFFSRGAGTIVTIGSSAGLQPLPYMSVYAASKAFVIRFTQAVQGELKGRAMPDSIEVILASPSGTATQFQETAGVKSKEGETLLTADDVAGAIIRRIGKGHAHILIGRSGQGMALAARLLPERLQIQLWERLMRSMR